MLLFLHFIEILKMQFYMQVCKWWKFRKTFTFKLKPLKGHKMPKFIVQFV